MPVNGGVNPILFVDQLVSPGAAYSQKYGIQGVRQLRSYYSLCNSIWCISYLLARLATCIYVHCQVISASDNIYSSLFLTIKNGRLYRFWIYIYKHTYGNLNASSEPTTYYYLLFEKWEVKHFWMPNEWLLHFWILFSLTILMTWR